MLACRCDATATNTERKTIPVTATSVSNSRTATKKELVAETKRPRESSAFHQRSACALVNNPSFEVSDDLSPTLASGKPMANDLLW